MIKSEHIPWEFDLTRSMPPNTPALILSSDCEEEISVRREPQKSQSSQENPISCCPWENFLDDTYLTGVISTDSLVTKSHGSIIPDVPACRLTTVSSSSEICSPTPKETVCLAEDPHTDTDDDVVVVGIPATHSKAPTQSKTKVKKRCKRGPPLLNPG